MIRYFFTIIVFSLTTLLNADENSTDLKIKIINTKTNSIVTWQDLLKEMENFDVMLWGEEHDDGIGHIAQIEFFKKFSDKFPSALSLEMLEKDQQMLVNEYSSGYIPEKQFLEGIRLWKNFQTDYLPLVKIAKESYSPIICANPPRRYVNAIARKGIIAYMDFGNEAHYFLPEAYTLGLYQSETYLAKLRSMFQSSHTSGAKGIPSPESMILAQYMWDQGMAESVSRESFRSGRKILHINGRFHSDEEGGLTFRLRKMGHKVLVVSVFPEGKEENANFSKIADFVILTNGR